MSRIIKLKESDLVNIAKRVIKEQQAVAQQTAPQVSKTQTPVAPGVVINGVKYKLPQIKDLNKLNTFLSYGGTTEEKASVIARKLKGGSVIFDSLSSDKKMATSVVKITDAYLMGVARYGLKINEPQFRSFNFFTQFMDEPTKVFFQYVVGSQNTKIPQLAGLIPVIVLIAQEQLKKISV